MQANWLDDLDCRTIRLDTDYLILLYDISTIKSMDKMPLNR